jgi:uridine phosphorylase
VLGHDCLSISVIVANRISLQFSQDNAAAIRRMIEKCIAIIAHM